MDVFADLLATINWRTLAVTTLRIALVFVLAWIVLAIARSALARLEARLVRNNQIKGEPPGEAEKRADTLVRLVRQGVILLVWIVVGLVVLKQVGVDVAPILASAGIAGLAIGFGAQNLVKDVIAGFFIILENQVRVGDVAVLNGTSGLVEEINFRTMVLRDLSGTVHVFPNGTITTLSNMTHGWSGYVMDIGVAYKEDIDHVTGVMRAVAAEMQQDEHFGPFIIADMEIFGVNDFADSAVVIKARLKTTPIKQWEVGREYRRRLKMAFDREGIEIPFPHRSIYFGEASRPFRTEAVGPEEPVSQRKDAKTQGTQS